MVHRLVLAAVVCAAAPSFAAGDSRVSTETRFNAARTTYLQTLAQSDYDKMKSLSNTGSSQVLLARVGLGVGVAALAAATYFWVAGDDPHKYEGFREVVPEPAAKKASLRMAPLDGGLALALAGSF